MKPTHCTSIHWGLSNCIKIATRDTMVWFGRSPIWQTKHTKQTTNQPSFIDRLHSSPVGVKLGYAFYWLQQTMQKCWAKTILLSKMLVCFDFFSSNFNFQGQVLSSNGVSLIPGPGWYESWAVGKIPSSP
jgi:hypothetical protein